MDVMLSTAIIMWSNALPESLSHLVMYGMVVWMVGTAETYSGVMLVMWCMMRCFGVLICSVFIVCWVGAGDCAWKSPMNMNDVVGNFFRMMALVVVIAGMHEYVSLCWTSYIFIRVRCLVLVWRVTHWHRPLAVMWVCTIAGAMVELIIVIQ